MVKKCPRKNFFIFFNFFRIFLGLIQSLGKKMSVTANFWAKFQKFEILDRFWGLYRWYIEKLEILRRKSPESSPEGQVG